LPTGPITATLRINGVTQSSVVIDHAGIPQGTPIRISLQATTSLASGEYDAEIVMTAPIGTSTQMQTLTQQVLVEDRSNSAYGKGWNLSGVEKLIPQSNGTLFINGAGVRVWYNSSGAATSGMMANSPLVQQSDMSWRLNLPDGSYHTFDPSGRMTATVDAFGNSVNYSYDVTSGLLTSVTDAVGRITTLSYANGKLSNVTDYGGRFVVLTHDTDGQLVTISSPASFQVGPVSPPVMTYSYNGAGLISTLTDTLQRSTSLTYSYADRLASAILPGGAAWSFAPAALVGLVNTATGTGTTSNPAPRTLPVSVLATWINPLGAVRKLAVDALGNVIREIAPDGSETTYTRNANGQILTATLPDPDGSRPLPSPVTTYVYNTSGTTAQVTFPGGATQSWTYNSNNLPLTAATPWD
jgi:YD repeat-containing protein